MSDQFDYYGFTSQEVDMIRGMCPPNVPERDFRNFLYFCKKFKLDPIQKQAYLVPRGKKDNLKWSAEASIDGLRLNAERTGCYAPGRAATWELDSNGHPVTSTAYIMKLVGNTWLEVSHTVFYDEFVQTSYDKNGKPVPNHFWSRMPRQMLAKVAEAFCLRKAFPNELGGMYTPEEMGIDAIPFEDARTITHSDKDTKKKNQETITTKSKESLSVYDEVVQLGKTLKSISANFPPFPNGFKQLDEKEQYTYLLLLRDAVNKNFESQYLAALSSGAITANDGSEFEDWQSLGASKLCQHLVMLVDKNKQAEIKNEITRVGKTLKAIGVTPLASPKPWKELSSEDKIEYSKSLHEQLISVVNQLADTAAESEVLTPGEVEESESWSKLPIIALTEKAQDLFNRVNNQRAA